jgi:hypothetical protein
MAWDCTKFNDIIFDQAPHFDKEILKDWKPTDDAWVGHVATMPWDAFTGALHTYDQFHMGMPDLSQAWSAIASEQTGCVTNACDNPAICVGWGETRKDYGLEQTTYETNVLCFDQINTKAKAKDLMGRVMSGLKTVSKEVWSDYMRRNSLMLNETLYIATMDGTGITVPITAGMFTGGMATIDLGAVGNLPTTELTIQYLQRQYAPLIGNGYFGGKFVPNGMFKLITDPITSNDLIEANPNMSSFFRSGDVRQIAELYKYGVSATIGNFGISWDMNPARFYHTGDGVLTRVWPYTNVAADIGIKREWNTQYELAPIQYSVIWHPEAMKRATPNLESVNGDMPFLTRDLGGMWNFTGGNRDRFFQKTDPTTAEVCNVDNKKGNKGFLWADFRSGFKFEYPQWTRPILHLREPGCLVNSVPCSTPPAYIDQDYSGCNAICQE